MDSNFITQQIDSKPLFSIKRALFLGAALSGMLYLAFIDYYIFHSLVEGACVVIAMSVSILSFNVYIHGRKNELTYFGLSYGLIGLFNFLHLISYSNAGIFSNYGLDISIQLSIITWYLEGGLFLLAFILLKKEIKLDSAIIINVSLGLLLILVLFYLDLFPVSYIKGIGQTQFNLYSRYITMGVFLINILLVGYYRRDLPKDISYLIMISFVLKIIAVLIFVFYKGQPDELSVVAHLFRFISFYFIYKFSLESGFRKAYTEITVSEERYRTLTELLPEGVCILDQDKIKSTNDKFLDILGVKDKDKILGKSVFKFIHPEHKMNVRELMRIMKQGIIPREIEERFIREDGISICVELTITPFSKGGETLLVIKNITERRLAERKLKETQEEYQKLLDLLPEGVAVSSGGKILFANKALINMIGTKKPEDILGKNKETYLRIHPDYEVTEKIKIEELMKDKKAIPFFERKIMTSKDESLDVEIAYIPLIYKDGDSVMSIVRDISERKKVEAERKLLREKIELERIRSEFFANLSHEFKTPINVILSSLQLLDVFIEACEESKGFFNIKKYMMIMKQNAFRLVRLVNNLVDVTKIDSGYYKVNLQNNNVISIIEEITLSVASYIEDKGLHLTFDTNEEERIIACDPDIMERIMLNLLSNAIKFTDRGGDIFVTITSNEESIKISVKDTGLGIPKGKIDSVFERFSQVDKSLTRDHEGSGIGLSLVKGLVEIQEGKISVESEYKKGSEFIIELPVKKLLSNESIFKEQNHLRDQIVEKITIEFSDIYSLKETS